MTKPALADQYDDQIAALRKEISQYQDVAKKLSKKADTLQRELDKIANEKAQLQAQINLSQRKYDKLAAKIAQAEKDIQSNRQALGTILSDYYIEGDTTTLELLASSDNIADFVDKQAYRESIQKSLSSTVKKIEGLKKQLEDDKKQVQEVLTDLKNQRKALADKEAEKQNLINQTKGNEAAYRKLIKDGDKQIQEVQSAQDAARAAALERWSNSGGSYVTVGGSGGGYPWAYPSTQCWSNSCIDPWGLYYRECVSYVAWKLDNEGYGVKNFNGAGNATQWPATTSSYATSRSGSNYTPRRGDAVVIPAWHPDIGHQYGHIMYVEDGAGSRGGAIRISEFNWIQSQYSEREISSSQYASYVFITFPKK